MTMETDIPNVVAADSVEMREREEYPAILALRGMGYTITDDPGGWFGIGGGGYDVVAPDGTTSNPSGKDIMELFTENVEQPVATATQYYTDKGFTVVPLQDGSYALSDPSNLQKQPIVLTARELIAGYKDDASRRSGDATGAGTTGAAPTGLTGVPFFNQSYQVWSVRYPDGRVEPLEVATDPGLKKIWAYLRTIPVDQIASPTDAQSVLSDAYQYLGQNPITPKAPGEIVRGEDVGGPPGSFFIRQPSGTLTPYRPPAVEEEEEILTLDQQIAKLVGEGRIDEAMKLDQVRDQLNEERLTPERAAEMLVDIAYNPADFKQMMDAMLGRDSGLDATTVDIPQLQAQATRMLKGTEAEGLQELPEAFQSLASGAQTGKDLTRARYQAPAIEGDISAEDQDQVVVPPPVYDRQRAVDRDLMAGTVPFPSRGLMPAGRMTATDEEEFAPGISFEQKVRRSNLDQRPSLLDYEDIEMGDYGRVAPTEDTDPFNTLAFIKKHRNPNDPKNWLTGPELRKIMSEKGMLDSGQEGVDREFTPQETSAAAATLGKDIAQLGYDAFKRSQEAQELRDLYSGANYPGSLNIPYTSTRERLRELGKYLGKDAAAFERNQRLQQQRRQQIFEARRPTTRRYM